MISDFINYFEPTIGNPMCMGPVIIFLIIASRIDIKKMQIPDKVNMAFLCIRLMMSAGLYEITADHLEGAVTGFLLVCIPAMILLWKMGGDIKMTAVLGLWIGMGGIIFSMAAGLIFFFGWALIKKKGKREPVAWAPFVSLGIVTLMLTYFVFKLL